MLLYNKYISKLFASKFSVDLIFNIVSFFICGVIGVLFNVIIIRYYDAATLGFFNQIYAVFIFLSQVSTWGLHLSVQKFIPQYSKQRKHISNIFTSALIVTLIFSSFITLITLCLKNIPGYIFNSEAVKNGFIYAVPGLLFFSLNKVILAFMNGMRFMIAFAIFNFLRFALMLILLVYILLSNIQERYLALIFSIPEAILFLALFLYNIKYYGYSSIKRLIHLCKLHFRFGSHAALGNIFLDINSKVDVIILGMFLPDGKVGIYSFAAFIVDGFLQLFLVFRTNINPIITKIFYSEKRAVLEKMVRTKIVIFYKIFIIIGISAIVIYPIFLKLLKVNEFFLLNFAIFSILSIGCIAGSGYIPFQMIFNQTGFPRLQSIFLFCIFAINVLLNFILVPIWGVLGSAVATSLAFVIQAVLLKRMVFHFVQIKI